MNVDLRASFEVCFEELVTGRELGQDVVAQQDPLMLSFLRRDLIVEVGHVDGGPVDIQDVPVGVRAPQELSALADGLGLQRLTTAYLCSALTSGDLAWPDARAALGSAPTPWAGSTAPLRPINRAEAVLAPALFRRGREHRDRRAQLQVARLRIAPSRLSLHWSTMRIFDLGRCQIRS
jgi:hypothetical protein